MTSKDKLIEFLKSANIEYKVEIIHATEYIIAAYSEYVFDINGDYLYVMSVE